MKATCLKMMLMLGAVAAGGADEGPFIEFVGQGGKSPYKSVQVTINAAGAATVTVAKQTGPAIGYGTSLSRAELDGLRDAIQAGKFFTRPEEDDRPTMDAGRTTLTVHMGEDNRTLSCRHCPDLERLTGMLWGLVVQAETVRALERDDDIYQATGVVNPQLAGIKALQPAQLKEPLLKYIATQADRQRVEWALTALACVTTAEKFSGVVAQGLADAKQREVLLTIVGSHPFCGNIPKTHWQALGPSYLAFAREARERPDRLTKAEAQALTEFTRMLGATRYAPSLPIPCATACANVEPTCRDEQVVNRISQARKEETMKRIRILSLVASSAALTLSPAAADSAKAEPLPYGHKDFVPTPERPVYFRQTYGNYPGATPPLEWWEGTPTTKKVKVGDSKSSKEAEVPDFADQKSKNILWKVPVPGWSLSHPIVVGKKVFAVGEPDFVTCWDLDTGKQLWQRRIMPLLCDGLSEEKAAAGQKVLDLARAIWLVTGGGSTTGEQEGNFYNYGTAYGVVDKMDMTEGTVAKRTAFVGKVLRMAQKHRPDVEAFGDVELLKALDEDIAILQSWAKAQQDPNAIAAMRRDGKARSDRLVSVCARKFGVPFGGAWWGMVGTADSTLASDGQRIYGVFDQGQVFALDLDGKTVWMQREKGTRVGGNRNGYTFHRSPLLCRDLLLVLSCVPGKTQPRRAFDAATGKLRWEVPLAPSNHAMPCLMRLPGADGKLVDALIDNTPGGKDQGQAVLRVTDGKILGYLPHHLIARGPMMAVFGQQVTWAEDTGPACSYRLRLDDAGTVVTEKVFVMEKGGLGFRAFNFLTVAGTTVLNNDCLIDATTGTLISKLPARMGDLGVVAGHHLITQSQTFGWHGDDNSSPWGRKRGDRMTFGVFKVIDIKDPAKPVMVAKNNLLGYKEPPADIIVSTYLKDFDPYDFAGCYKGSAGYFAMVGGPVPVGNKLLIQSSAWLYCIGEK